MSLLRSEIYHPEVGAQFRRQLRECGRRLSVPIPESRSSPSVSHQVVTKRRRLHLRNDDRAGLTRRMSGGPRKRTVRYAEEGERMQHSQETDYGADAVERV